MGLADFCKQQLDVFSVDVAVENEVAKVPVGAKILSPCK